MSTAVSQYHRNNWWVRSRAWMGLLIITPFAMLALLSKPTWPEGSWGDLDLDVIGWCLFVAGAGFRWWSTLYIGGRKKEMLVADGPYSMCRNPLYLGTCLMGVAIAMFLQSLTFCLGLAIAAVVYLSITVPSEERTLLEKLGEPYRRYLARVPRFIPNPRLFQSPEMIEVNIRGLYSEAWRCARWLWIPVIGEAIALLRTAPWWPIYFKLP